jgi:hypothetical protein
MAYRTFTDPSGGEWQVWEVNPSALLETTPEAAWLAFQSATEKRRLAPVPAGWADASEAELLGLLHRATAVAPRSPTPRGVAAIVEEPGEGERASPRPERRRGDETGES